MLSHTGHGFRICRCLHCGDEFGMCACQPVSDCCGACRETGHATSAFKECERCDEVECRIHDEEERLAESRLSLFDKARRRVSLWWAMTKELCA